MPAFQCRIRRAGDGVSVERKPHDLVANPPGVFSAEKTRTLIGHLTKLAETQGRIFGGLPYRKFVYFYFFRRAEGGAPVLEHQNSFVALIDAGAQAPPEALLDLGRNGDAIRQAEAAGKGEAGEPVLDYLLGGEEQ